MVEDRTGLERELVLRQVRRRERKGGTQIGERLLGRLFRQAVHEIEIEVGQTRRDELIDRATDVIDTVNAPERFQVRCVETLCTERHARNTGTAIAAETSVLDRAGICFERNFHVGRARDARAYAFHESADRLRRKQTRRTAAKKDRDECAITDVRQIVVEVREQRVDVLRIRHPLGRDVRIEIAVRALTHAPRHVNVERQRQWRERHRSNERVSAARHEARSRASRAPARDD